MKRLGSVFRIITALGVLFRAYNEHSFCRKNKLAVLDSVPFGRSQAPGHIVFDCSDPVVLRRYCRRLFLPSFIVGTTVCLLSGMGLFIAGEVRLCPILFFLGLTFLCNCFPDEGTVRLAFFADKQEGVSLKGRFYAFGSACEARLSCIFTVGIYLSLLLLLIKGILSLIA